MFERSLVHYFVEIYAKNIYQTFFGFQNDIYINPKYPMEDQMGEIVTTCNWALNRRKNCSRLIPTIQYISPGMNECYDLFVVLLPCRRTPHPETSLSQLLSKCFLHSGKSQSWGGGGGGVTSDVADGWTNFNILGGFYRVNTYNCVENCDNLLCDRIFRAI